VFISSHARGYERVPVICSEFFLVGKWKKLSQQYYSLQLTTTTALDFFFRINESGEKMRQVETEKKEVFANQEESGSFYFLSALHLFGSIPPKNSLHAKGFHLWKVRKRVYPSHY